MLVTLRREKVGSQSATKAEAKAEDILCLFSIQIRSNCGNRSILRPPTIELVHHVIGSNVTAERIWLLWVKMITIKLLLSFSVDGNDTGQRRHHNESDDTHFPPIPGILLLKFKTIWIFLFIPTFYCYFFSLFLLLWSFFNSHTSAMKNESEDCSGQCLCCVFFHRTIHALRVLFKNNNNNIEEGYLVI